MYKQARRVIFVLVCCIFALSCASAPATNKLKQNQICEDVGYVKKILQRISDNFEESSDKKLYFVVTGSMCRSCPKLKKDISKLALDGELYYLNVDFTWSFLLTKQWGVRGAPTLIVVTKGMPRFGKEGHVDIVEYLHANQRARK